MHLCLRATCTIVSSKFQPQSGPVLSSRLAPTACRTSSEHTRLKPQSSRSRQPGPLPPNLMSLSTPTSKGLQPQTWNLLQNSTPRSHWVLFPVIELAVSSLSPPRLPSITAVILSGLDTCKSHMFQAFPHPLPYSGQNKPVGLLVPLAYPPMADMRT